MRIFIPIFILFFLVSGIPIFTWNFLKQWTYSLRNIIMFGVIVPYIFYHCISKCVIKLMGEEGNSVSGKEYLYLNWKILPESFFIPKKFVLRYESLI